MGTIARRVLLDRGGGVAVLALVAYVALVSPSIVDGDNAEFATLGTIGGVAHPTGYPALLLWLRAWSWLPGSTPAQTAAIATAMLGALGVLVVHAACRAWGATTLAATAAAAMYAATPEVIRVSTEAEVFALNQLVVAAVLWLSATAGPLRGTWRVVGLAAVAGVGLAGHVTCVLVAPVGVLGVVRGFRETSRSPAVVAAIGIAALVAGLLPYAYLFVTAPSRYSWGEIDSVEGLVRHILREDYGGPGTFAPDGDAVPFVDNLMFWLATVARGWLYVPLAGGAAWLAWACARRRPASEATQRESRLGWGLLAASLVLAGPLLIMRFNLRLDDTVNRYIVRRFHLMSLVILAPAVAMALDVAFARIAARSRSAWLVVHAGLVAAVAVAAPGIAAVHTSAYEDYSANLLRSLPRGAIVIESSGIYFPVGYLQQIRDVRPDVIMVEWTLVKVPWLRARLAADGIDIVAGHDASTHLVTQLVANGRDVFVDASSANVLRELPTYPYGTLYRVLPPGTPRPPIETVYADNRKLFDDFTIDATVPGADDEYATFAYSRYAHAWRVISRALAAAGNAHDAAEAAALARALAPRAW